MQKVLNETPYTKGQDPESRKPRNRLFTQTTLN